MTRINVVPVSTLHRLHLHAEYKELPAVFTMVQKRLATGLRIPTVEEYTLGQGHMMFFADKLEYLAKRYGEICIALTGRGYRLNPRNLRKEFASIPAEYWGEWDPTPVAIALNRDRISQRLASMEARGIR